MAACCYNPKSRGISDNESCQFGKEDLIEIENVHFCRYHLPWSPEDLLGRFGINIGDDHPNRDRLKDRWSNDQKEKIRLQILHHLNHGVDLSGVVAASDIIVGEEARNILYPDALFPAKFETRYSCGNVDLRRATFYGPASFGGQITESLDLSCASFKDDVTFGSGRSFVNAELDKCRFAKTARFRNCQFVKSLSFKECVFEGLAQFERCELGGADTVSFDGAQFRGPVSFRAGGEQNVNRAFFRNAVFENDAGFEGRHFRSSLIFRGAKFSRAPRFQDAKISFESVFPKLDGFLDWKTIPKGIDKKSEKEYYERASQAYRTLRYAMKEQDAYEEEARFWELEMRAKARELSWDKAGWLPKLFSFLYAATSRYGNSIGRPLAMWIIIWLCFIGVYALFHVGLSFEASWPYVEISDFSFQQTVRPFGVWSDEGGRRVAKLVFDNIPAMVPSGQILLVRLLATAQSVISLSCIALFGFALRRRFRMA